MRWLTGHKNDVRAVAFTPTGQLVSGGSDRTVRVWDPASGECLRTIKAKAPVYAVAAAPDGATIAYAGRYASRAEANFVFLCDPAGTPVGRYELRTEGIVRRPVPGSSFFERIPGPVPRSIWALAFSADGRYLAAACRVLGGGNFPNGGGGWVWDMTRPGGARPLPGNDIYTTTFAPDGRALAVTRLKVVEFRDEPWKTAGVSCRTPTNYSPAVAFVPGHDLAVIASGRSLVFVNPVRREKAVQVKTDVRTVSAVASAPDGRTVLAGGRSGAVEVYDPAARARTTTYDFGIGGVHGLAFAPDGLTFAVAGDNGLVVCDGPG
ncbi:MAG: hypothetical protein JWO38_6242 [Gemmataceae bacterium]|nr:hypothetical protein [Gemmataceae bacterium]